jgi:hypothetical protein
MSLNKGTLQYAQSSYNLQAKISDRVKPFIYYYNKVVLSVYNSGKAEIVQ